MSIAERLKEIKEDGPPWQTCSVNWIKSKLDEKEQSALEELINTKDIGFQRISRIIEQEVGENISAQSISRHKRGICKCENKK